MRRLDLCIRSQSDSVRRCVVLCTVVVTAAAAASTCKAQSDATRRETSLDSVRSSGKPVSGQEVSDAILQSGLTAQEIRQRLQAAGYDPRLADVYLNGSPASQSAQSQPSAAFIEALRSAGILRPMSYGTDQSVSDANPDLSDIAGV